MYESIAANLPEGSAGSGTGSSVEDGADIPGSSAGAPDALPCSAEVRSLDVPRLNEVAAQLRRRLIEVTAVNGGHLASSLGAVELILALHRVYDFPTDRLVFDVGHQAYAHKLITGRADAFDTLRTYGGLSGFPRRKESSFDAHDAGHASDSLSIALGLALARDINGSTEDIVALIGDAALSGGMAFEALNQTGQLGIDMTILLNDNEMSISRSVGALSLYLGKARTSRPYTALRDTVEGRVGRVGRLGRFLVSAGEAAKGSFKKLMVPGTLFEDMGITYIGPIDGHNIEAVSEALRLSRKASGPVLVHAVTQKGHGYAPAERQPEAFHGLSRPSPVAATSAVSPTSAAASTFPSVGGVPRRGGVVLPADDSLAVATESDTALTAPAPAPSPKPTYTSVFSQALLAEARLDPDIVAITAAMTDGTGLAPFKEAFERRFFDVGIAEEHAVALAGGLALGGKLPVVAIYSTFLQRALDQAVIDVALQEQHVVFAVDRAGLVGEDGSTHHGLFDLAYLRSIPHMRIIAPADAAQMRDALHTALALDGPVALRYPRGEPVGGTADEEGRRPRALPVGRATRLREGGDLSILAVGRMVAQARDAAALLATKGVEAAVYNMLWVKPIDEGVVRDAARAPLVVTLEEGTVVGGFGTAVLEALACGSVAGTCPQTRVLVMGVPDSFVGHGSVEQLFDELGLTPPQIAERILHALGPEGRRRSSGLVSGEAATQREGPALQ
ncbi:MAG: 1-deoxy-D-xylulose-5-phosphate synthase [Coriobacteriales bacterium]|jgi:1-deoxy-D-xylulose-5-phosphate synthase|nr:1-deoxy-D-xylulose-5-phosphate synthase [Coriobacteriales bacterium]